VESSESRPERGIGLQNRRICFFWFFWRPGNLLFLVETNKSRSLVPITAKSSSGDRHLAAVGMTSVGAFFPACQENYAGTETNMALPQSNVV
jgi:hypothetical protein